MKVALCLEYDGSGFSGWQSQPSGNTVQDVLEKALAKIAGERVRTVCAGRTDAGVHALAQVVHFDTDVARPDTAWVRGVNAHLPPAVSVRWASTVAEDFHARFGAQARRYNYLLLNRRERPGLWGGKVGWYHRPLDLDLMHRSAQCLLGEHDFSSFRSSECQAKSPVKRLHQCDIIHTGSLLIFSLRANAFLHHMVRNIVGALVYVGSGRLPSGELLKLLEAQDRSLAPPTFAPDGLYFAGVEYDASWGLPQEGRIIASPVLPFI